jgi:hypothetical protein
MSWKKNYLMLQMFAGDAGSGNGTDGATGSEENKGAANNGQQSGNGNGNGGSTQQKDAPKYTDADVNALLNKKFAEWQQKKERETSEAERLAKMTAEQRANERLATLEKELNQYKAAKAREDMASQARSILREKNINVADGLISNLIAADAETTKANCEAFISLYQQAVESGVKEKLKGTETPKKGGTSGYTKEQILAIADTAERQRLIRENMHLFS